MTKLQERFSNRGTGKTGIRQYAGELSLQECLFFGFFIILSVTKAMGLYEGQALFELLVLPAILMGIMKLLLTPYTAVQWIMQIVLLIITGVVYFNSHERGILFLMLSVLGMKNMSVKKVFRVGLVIWSLCSICQCIFNYPRLEHTIYRVHSKLGLGPVFRWSLGFTHPNILHITYLILCAYILYELQEHYKLRHVILLMAGNILVFLYSVSYTGFGITGLLLLGGYYGCLRKHFCPVEKIMANLVLPLCLFLSFVCPAIMFDTPYAGPVQRLNHILNTRIYLAYCFLNDTYVSLFGRDISKVVQSSMTLDNSYIWGFINYGAIPFALLMLGYLILMVYTSCKNRTMELVILVCFLGAGYMEPFLFNTSFKNITLLLLGAMLFTQKENAVEYTLFEKWSVMKVKVPLVGMPAKLWRDICVSARQNRKKVAIGVAAGMLLGALLCGIVYKSPEGYLVPRSYTDGLDKTYVTLDGMNDPAYEGYRIMNYSGTETPMQPVTGKAVELEKLRYYAGAVLIGGFMTGTAVILAKRKRVSGVEAAA